MGSVRWAFVLYLLIMYLPAMAQQPDYLRKENSIWMFGQAFSFDTTYPVKTTGIGLNFSATPPVVVPAFTAGFGEAQASVCDANGNLLFYTTGTFVFDAHGKMMPHGDSLVADPALYKFEGPQLDSFSIDPTSSTTQGALIVPMLNAPGKYYVFSLTASEFSPDGTPGKATIGTAGELFYSIVDMGLNNGLGDVVASRRAIFLDSSLNESMVAIAGTHCDIWVLVHAIDSPLVKAYHVTADGLNPVPVLSTCGHAIMPYNGTGAIKASPDRKKIVVCHRYGSPELFNFNAATGKVTNARALENDSGKNNAGAYQACFSPDNTKLYVNTIATLKRYVIQFDLADATLHSSYLVDTDAYYTDIQIGPDGKLYLTDLVRDASGVGVATLSCIQQPNLAGAACGYTRFAITAPPGSAIGLGLHNMYVPSLVTTSFVTHTDAAFCTPRQDSLALAASAGFDHYLWSTGSTGSTAYVHGTGVYTLTSTNECAIRYDTFRVRDVDVSFSLGADTVYCYKPVILQAQVAGASYLWQDGSTNSSYAAERSGVYFVQASELGCTYADTVQISIHDVQQNLGGDTVICSNNRVVQLTLNANVPAGGQAEWSNGSTELSIAADTGRYWVTVTAGQCIGTDTVNIQIQLCNCMGNMPNAFTPNGDGKNDTFHPIFEPGCPINGYTFLVFNRWGNIVFSSANPSDEWDGTCHGANADLGIYMYAVQFVLGTDNAHVHRVKGDVVLVR